MLVCILKLIVVYIELFKKQAAIDKMAQHSDCVADINVLHARFWNLYL